MAAEGDCMIASLQNIPLKRWALTGRDCGVFSALSAACLFRCL